MSDDEKLLLPIDLNNVNDFEVLLHALKNKESRLKLRNKLDKFPQPVVDLIQMLDDQKFLRLANDVYERYNNYTNDNEKLEKVLKSKDELQNYLTSTYPKGYNSIVHFAKSLPTPELPTTERSDLSAATIDIALNALVAINVVVSANAAVASHVAVAAIAVSVVFAPII